MGAYAKEGLNELLLGQRIALCVKQVASSRPILRR